MSDKEEKFYTVTDHLTHTSIKAYVVEQDLMLFRGETPLRIATQSWWDRFFVAWAEEIAGETEELSLRTVNVLKEVN